MWIINDSATRRHFNADLPVTDDETLGDLIDDPVDDLPGDGYGVDYGEPGAPVQVTADVGEALVAHYETIRPYEAGDTE